jgi:broad specificity phosphatase PhoE
MRVFIVTHPEVLVDPAVPVPRWSLRDLGIARMRSFARRPEPAELGAIWSSDETKAIEAAGLLAAAHGLGVLVHPGLAEIDRSATGFLPHDEHDATADQCFARPQQSIRGWERAADAQARMLAAVEDILAHPFRPALVSDAGTSARPEGGSDLALVTHGGVATLLLCHLLGVPIDRGRDQPGQGHFFTFDRQTRQVLTGWERIEAA